MAHARARCAWPSLRFGVAAAWSAPSCTSRSHAAATPAAPVLPQLAKLAMANDPGTSVGTSIGTRTACPPAAAPRSGAGPVTGAYLERTFYPEVVATFRVAARNDIDPLAITGSGAARSA